METLTRPIFLLTDFGTQDHHTGQVRAVISGIAPAAAIHDLTHDAEPFAVDHGAWLLETALPAIPGHSVVLAVVDPGVGSSRRGLAVASGGRFLVGPDNGILSCALRGASAVVELAAPDFHREFAAPTFHARDIFAPVAARLASGLGLERLGPEVTDPVILPEFAGAEDASGRLRGYVVHIDRFGNAITTVRASQLPARYTVHLGERRVEAAVRTFAEAPPGDPVSYIDSSGFLALAVNQGNAAATLGLRRGDAVMVVPA